MNFPPLNNDTFIRALLKQSVDYTPVWMMRQAGRYLPEYRALRAEAGDFLTLCKTPELACEVTLQPLRRFDLDAAILFSDILTIPDAMGLGLYFDVGEGPKFKQPIRTLADVEALPKLTIDTDLKYVLDATRLIRHSLKGQVPLIGFSGSPWTLATYMIEGGSSKDFRRIKRMMYETPDVLHALLEKLADAVTDYLNGQIQAGAQAVQIFDTWGGVLTPQAYEDFSLNYMTKIIQGLIKQQDDHMIPAIVFTKNAGLWLEKIAQSGANAVGLDWCVDIADARRRIGSQVALQGNMDPAVLYADEKTIRATVKNILEKYGCGAGHVFNLGHGIAQDVDPNKAKIFIDAVHELSVSYHNN